MFKEIQAISQEIITLNSQVHGTVLSTKNLLSLKKNWANIELIKKNINHLLDEISLTSETNTDEILRLLSQTKQLVSQLGKSIEKIHALMDKLVCNYRDQWEKIHRNNK